MDPSLNEKLITTKYAGELSGYTSDYLSRLLRSWKIKGKRIGRNWLVERESLVNFLDTQGSHNVDRARTLAGERAREYREHRSFLRRATKKLTESLPTSQPADGTVSSFSSKIPVAAWGIPAQGLGSQALALAAGFLVVTFGALAAHAS